MIRWNLLLWLLCGMAMWVQAQGAATPIAFDIPAQPLNVALDRFAHASGWPVLFHSPMVTGRMSSAVSGTLPPAAALRMLLEGTGLRAEQDDSGPADAYVLRERDPPPGGAASAAAPVDFDYGGRVQAAVWRALCANPRVAPGDYRALVRVWVDAGGRVRDADLIGSTGEARRDAELLRVLGRVRVAKAPPAEMAQPLAMLILPQVPGDGTQCDAVATGRP